VSNNLYFIPILFEALESADPVESLRRAFRTIVTLGKDERFRKGYEQFKVFMVSVLAAYRLGVRTGEAEATAIDGADETTDLLDALAALPGLAEVWDSVKRELELEPNVEIHVEFLLRRNDEPPQSLQLSEGRRKGLLRGLVPGAYALSLSSGGVIWEAVLTKEDLLSAYAFADEALQLAADTGRGSENPTRHVVLLDGEVMVRVFAGLKSGKLEIEWRRA